MRGGGMISKTLSIGFEKLIYRESPESRMFREFTRAHDHLVSVAATFHNNRLEAGDNT